MRWNLSSRARELSSGNAIVISIPKSGRTWVRTFLNAYFSYKVGRQFSLNITDCGDAGVQRIINSNARYEHQSKANAWNGIRRKYLILASTLRRWHIVHITRDRR